MKYQEIYSQDVRMSWFEVNTLGNLSASNHLEQ